MGEVGEMALGASKADARDAEGFLVPAFQATLLEVEIMEFLLFCFISSIVIGMRRLKLTFSIFRHKSSMSVISSASSSGLGSKSRPLVRCADWKIW